MAYNTCHIVGSKRGSRDDAVAVGMPTKTWNEGEAEVHKFRNTKEQRRTKDNRQGKYRVDFASEGHRDGFGHGKSNMPTKGPTEDIGQSFVESGITTSVVENWPDSYIISEKSKRNRRV